MTDGYDYYDNEAPLRANRGALGFATPEAQEPLGGAYVLAPQSTSAWMLDGDGFAPLVMEAIEEVARPLTGSTRRRVHVVGCSNGGYMSLQDGRGASGGVRELGADLLRHRRPATAPTPTSSPTTSSRR